jgi:hypothetical protein
MQTHSVDEAVPALIDVDTKRLPEMLANTLGFQSQSTLTCREYVSL